LQFMPFNTLDPLLAGLNAKAIQEYCRETRQQVPKTDGGLVRCCYESLALKYREVD